MRLWYRFLREKRTVLLLYAVTVFLFIFVGSLYHIENLDMLFYAALLTLVAGGVIGFLHGTKYVYRSMQLEEQAKHFEQSGELILGEWDKGLKAAEDNMERAESFWEAQEILLSLVYEKKDTELRKWEEMSAECKDYYMMWTHQIKTPISALKLLLEGADAYGRDTFLMKEELFKIEQYVEMVLTFQRLGSISDDLVVQEYDLYSLVKQAVRKYSVLFINKGISLELEKMQTKILTDEKWFVFCMEQLLSNSIKYTMHGQIFIRTEAEGDKDNGQKFRLSIEDTGIGIRPEDLPRIFEKGFTGYNGRLDKKSTGIGLYLCRQIFTHLGITVKVESEEGKGTKVMLGLTDIMVKNEERYL